MAADTLDPENTRNGAADPARPDRTGRGTSRRYQGRPPRHAEEVAEKTTRILAIDTTTEGERLQRFEMQCHRRFYKCLDTFWKHRREMERAGGERTKIRRNTTWCGQRNGWCSSTYRLENKNETTEANPVSAALEVEADQGVLGTGKAFKLADAVVVPGVDGGDRGGIEVIWTPVVGERAVFTPVGEEFSRVSRRCDGIVDEFGAIWWANLGPGLGAVIGVRLEERMGAITKGTKVRKHERKDVAKRVNGGSSGGVPRVGARGYSPGARWGRSWRVSSELAHSLALRRFMQLIWGFCRWYW